MLALFPIAVLGLMGLINLARGAIHAFAPDGGAHSIAGLNLGDERATILALFASIGFRQMVAGAFQLLVVFRFRNLVWLFLAMQAAETALSMANLYFWRPFPTVVPGQIFNLALLLLQILALAFAVRPRATV